MTDRPPITSELLAPLTRLEGLSGGLIRYFSGLTTDTDPVLRVAAWRALMDQKMIPIRQQQALLNDCQYEAVRVKAVGFFSEVGESQLAESALASPVADTREIWTRLLQSRLEEDATASQAASESLFLATGDIQHLQAAVTYAEQTGGWQPAVRASVRAILAQPQSAGLFVALFTQLDSANQPDALRDYATLAKQSGVYGFLAEVATALAENLEGQGAACNKRVEVLLSDKSIGVALVPFQGIIRRLRAESRHSLGEYRAAYAAYVEVNAFDKASAQNVNASDFYRGVKFLSDLQIPEMPPGVRDDVLVMTGFPRSGTTLLENALAAHPDIETLEETRAGTIVSRYLSRVAHESGTAAGIKLEDYVEARRRYYAEIDRCRKRRSARFVIDKFPLRAADAKFSVRFLPGQRHIFSIRHPFDVVLSCFRQRFNPNPAMENFRTIADATRLYDAVMENWFSVHTLDDPSVHYVRYDALVTNFEDVTRGALHFIGLEWDDAIRSFAEKAASRANKTPSYQKVRKGLSIGVQSNWRNYAFLFQSPETKPLHKWAAFFGYDTK